MATEDLYNNLSAATTLAPAVRTGNATGETVDLQGFGGALVVAVVGTITDGTHALTVQESADGSTWSDVDAGDLQGSFATLESDTNQQVGYFGIKGHVRVNAGVAGATSGGAYAAAVITGCPRKAPV